MKMIQKIAGSKNDEYYTPSYAIKPILKYIPKKSIVWCPFDTKKSNFVNEFISHDCRVIYGHIDSGQDFFNSDVPVCDYIISNPPYSKKTEVFQKLFDIKIPFAMLLGVNGLFDNKKRLEMFERNNFEIMYLYPRISFLRFIDELKPSMNPAFQSVYVCKDILPKQICFERVITK